LITVSIKSQVSKERVSFIAHSKAFLNLNSSCNGCSIFKCAPMFLTGCEFRSMSHLDLAIPRA
jgi:hypothetical protein